MGRGDDNKSGKRNEEKRESAGASSGSSFLKGRTIKILLAGICLLLAAAICVGAGWILPLEMFSRNPRFTLMHVKVSAHPRGYWKDRTELVAEIMKVEKGRDNLFSSIWATFRGICSSGPASKAFRSPGSCRIPFSSPSRSGSPVPCSTPPSPPMWWMPTAFSCSASNA